MCLAFVLLVLKDRTDLDSFCICREASTNGFPFRAAWLVTGLVFGDVGPADLLGELLGDGTTAPVAACASGAFARAPHFDLAPCDGNIANTPWASIELGTRRDDSPVWPVCTSFSLCCGRRLACLPQPMMERS